MSAGLGVSRRSACSAPGDTVLLKSRGSVDSANIKIRNACSQANTDSKHRDSKPSTTSAHTVCETQPKSNELLLLTNNDTQ